MSIKAVLLGIKDQLSTEDKWSKGCFFRNAQGERIFSGMPGFEESLASCCLIGARMLVHHRLGSTQEQRDEVSSYMMQKCPEEHGLALFNDNRDRTFQEIHQYLDLCIAEAPE